MHAAAFGMKRAFHGFLRVARKPLASVGLTPARFDMLYVMFSRGNPEWGRRSITQSELRRVLGVCASVVSRMIRKLVALGFVTRVRSPSDRRQIDLSLRDRGWERIRTVQRWLIRGIHRLVLEAICFGQHRDPMSQLEHMERLTTDQMALRRHFFDTATLCYPWGHPDD
jgi:DNA-binding MarR family transcriptional regulator